MDNEAPFPLNPVDIRLLELQDKIRDFFNWKLVDDYLSANQLLATVEKTSVNLWTRQNRAITLGRIITELTLNKPKITVIGAAVEVDELSRSLEKPGKIVAADGAVGIFSNLPKNLNQVAWSRLSCIVSDGDGGMGTELAFDKKIPFILHSHGDNRKDWTNLIEKGTKMPTQPELVLTHQTPQVIEGMHNPGGFTDGDRALCFLLSLGVKKSQLEIIGTRTDLVGEWSGKTNPKTKLKKLKWMERVLQILDIKL